MKKQIFLFVTLIIIFLYFPACGGDSSSDGEKIIPPKFHTEDDEGYWKGMSDVHIPVIKFTGSNKGEIEVTVPLIPSVSPRHYIEVIVLVKNDKQVDAKKFEPGVVPAKAVFKLDKKTPGNYSVVAKCNLHDMWKTILKE